MRTRSSGILVALGCGLFACHNDPAALYDGSRPKSNESDGGPLRDAAADASEGSVALTPYEAALRIYGDDEACVQCVERECGEDAHACAGDTECAEDAACRAGCDNSACQYWSCRDGHPIDDRPTYALEDCLIAACPEACRVGHDFACAYRDGLPEPELDQPLSIMFAPRLGLTAERAPEGLRARVCAGTNPECEVMGAEARTDAQGQVTVQFPPWQRSLGAVRPFQGYVELTDPDREPPRVVPTLYPLALPQAPPRSNETAWEYGILSPDDLAALIAALGEDDDRSAGLLTGAAYDCRSSDRARAGGVTIEVTPAEERTKYVYNATLAATATEPTGAYGGIFSAAPLTPGRVTLTLLHEGEQVQRLELPVRAGAVTNVVLGPAPAR